MLYTQKEYEKKKETIIDMGAVKTASISLPKEKEKRTQYYMMYPEIPQGNNHAVNFTGTFDGKQYICKNAIVKTDNKSLYNYLLSQSYQLLKTEEN